MIFGDLGCLGDLITRNARNFPDAPGLIFEETRLTWKQVNDRVNRFANTVLGLGLKPAENLALLGRNSHRYLEVFFGLAKTEARSVKLNYRYAPKELVGVLKDCQAQGIVFEREFADMVRGLSTEAPSLKYFICLDGPVEGALNYEDMLASADPREPARDIQGDDLVMIQYTSGTTGLPKGVMMTHRGQILLANHGALTVGPARILMPLPLFTAAGTGRTLCHIYLANTVVLMREFAPRPLLEIIEREKVTVTGFVPSMFNILKATVPDLDRYDTSSLKRIIYGAAPMSVHLLKTAMETFPGCEFEQGYGLTETGPYGTKLMPEDHLLDGSEKRAQRLGSAGRMGINGLVKIVDTDDQELPPGEIGEIALYCDSNMVGYWNKPEETAATLRQGWVYTGDMGDLDEDGYLFIRDRKKDMIISGGFNIYPKEVEDALASHPAVLETAVIGVPDDTWGESVLGLVVLKDGWRASEQELMEHCLKDVARYKRPRRIEFLDSFPKTPLQKIQKNILRERYRNAAQRPE